MIENHTTCYQLRTSRNFKSFYLEIQKNGTLVVEISGTVSESGERNPPSTTFHNSIEVAFIMFAFNVGLLKIHGLAVLINVLNHMVQSYQKSRRGVVG